MVEVKAKIGVLSDDQIEKIHQYSVEILSRVGVRVDSKNARKVFDSASLKADKDNIVRIPPDVIAWALKAAPATVDIFNRSGDFVFRVGDAENSQTRFGFGVTNLYYQDPKSDRITPFARKHMQTSTRMAQALDSFDVVSTVGILQDCAPEVADYYGTLEMVANTTKPLIVLVSKESCFESTLDLIEHLHGDLVGRPFCIPYFNPITPLVLNEGTTDKMAVTIERGLPLIYNSTGMAGASSPITMAGTLALLNAEILAGLVYSQLVKEGATVILGALPWEFDMQNMEHYYTPRTLPLNLACAEMMHYYGVPHSGSSGSGPGWSADLNAIGILWMNHLTGCLGKVGLAPFVGGKFGSVVFSPHFVTYSNEVIRQARLFTRGFDLDDNSVNLDEIKSIGPGGNFFMAEQTMQLFRDTHFKDSIWPFLSLDEWQSGKHPNADAVLRQHTRELMENATPPDDHDELIERGEEFIRGLGA
ncbi:MAG: trimethylamine methyltransferase family protein [Deltaproteobacteria bacterium]|jgi:trimethylamine--corrinoid protein Co-methyltransferase|nr:trimethylamine methyltransferase family protein [Deltaproteobacteria bacterium]